MKSIIIENTTGKGQDTIIRDAATGEKIGGARAVDIHIDKDSFVTATVEFICVQVKGVKGREIKVKKTGKPGIRKLPEFGKIEKVVVEEEKNCNTCKHNNKGFCEYKNEAKIYTPCSVCDDWAKENTEETKVNCRYNTGEGCSHFDNVSSDVLLCPCGMEDN